MVEKTIHSIRNLEEKNVMEKAAAAFGRDYKNDHKLTAFTKLDFDNF